MPLVAAVSDLVYIILVSVLGLSHVRARRGGAKACQVNWHTHTHTQRVAHQLSHSTCRTHTHTQSKRSLARSRALLLSLAVAVAVVGQAIEITSSACLRRFRCLNMSTPNSFHAPASPPRPALHITFWAAQQTWITVAFLPFIFVLSCKWFCTSQATCCPATCCQRESALSLSLSCATCDSECECEWVGGRQRLVLLYVIPIVAAIAGVVVVVVAADGNKIHLSTHYVIRYWAHVAGNWHLDSVREFALECVCVCVYEFALCINLNCFWDCQLWNMTHNDGI